MKNMDRWLGDGGMPVLGAIGVDIDGYGDGWATATWVPTEMACNPHGTVQAGVHDVALDALMNFAINATLDGRDRTGGTLDMKSDYLRFAPEGATFTVRAEVTRLTRQIAFAEATVRNDEDQLVSRATAAFLVYRPKEDKG